MTLAVPLVASAALECDEFNAVEELERRTVVFVGDRVALQKPNLDTYGVHGVATLRVVERLKGKVPDETVVLDSADADYESWPVFTEPGRYLVFADPFSPEDAKKIGATFQIPLSCPKSRLLREL